MKKVILNYILAFVSATAFAFDVEIDGICYNLDRETNTAEVTWSANNHELYTGDIVIPETISVDGVTFTVTSFGHGAFGWSQNMTSISLPKTLLTIGSSAFYECSGLESLTIPENVTDIGESAFKLCCRLTSIVIPISVKNIDQYAFCGIDWKEVYVQWSEPLQFDEERYLFDYRLFPEDNTLYVPIGTSSKYAEADTWKYFKHFVEYDPACIEPVMQSDFATRSAIYTLDGKQLDSEPQKGVYIKDGKKIITK